VKLGGVEALLKLLRGGLDADSVRALIKALAELLKENTAQEVSLPLAPVPVLLTSCITWWPVTGWGSTGCEMLYWFHTRLFTCGAEGRGW
jgi:hypothetical protein